VSARQSYQIIFRSRSDFNNGARLSDHLSNRDFRIIGCVSGAATFGEDGLASIRPQNPLAFVGAEVLTKFCGILKGMAPSRQANAARAEDERIPSVTMVTSAHGQDHQDQIWESRLGSIEPESFAMLLVCQSIRPSSLRGWENQAIFATRSPTAIRNI
jgi:hypothetical protein